MLRRVPRNLRRAVLVTVLLAVTVSVWQSWRSGSPSSGDVVQTTFGPLGPADRDLLITVRLAGLWEQPIGQQAQQQGSVATVRDAGAMISAEHSELDQRVREVADQLGVLLPSRPTAQQLAWMEEISAKTGSDYDRAFAQRMREAHGAVLPMIAQVRASTRNQLIRDFAAEADTFVTRHIQYLESTGLVDYSALPQVPAVAMLSTERGVTDLILPALVFGAALFGAAGLAVAVRNRDSQRRLRARPSRSSAHRASSLPPMIAIPSPRLPEPGPRPRHAIRT